MAERIVTTALPFGNPGQRPSTLAEKWSANSHFTGVAASGILFEAFAQHKINRPHESRRYQTSGPRAQAPGEE